MAAVKSLMPILHKASAAVSKGLTHRASPLIRVCRLRTQLSSSAWLLGALFSFNVLSMAKADPDFATGFTALYEQELGSVRRCAEQASGEIKVCSNALRNDGNAPFALLPESPKATVVLFHGLADSPYYVRSIAEHLYQKNYAVIAPLLPGHGKLDARADMQDPALKQRWYQHVDDVMALVKQNSDKVFVGGHSAGGTLATRYMLQNPSTVEGLLLFSGTLQLSSSAETMSIIWGMKKLALWLDGEFETQGPNRYRYPKVASYSGLMLMDVIGDVRAILAEPALMSSIKTPIFAAHSLADNISPFAGAQDVMAKIPSKHTQFLIDLEFDVCHGDVVMSQLQIMTMQFDKAAVNQSERCAVPKANPLHGVMLSVLTAFLAEHAIAKDALAEQAVGAPQ